MLDTTRLGDSKTHMTVPQIRISQSNKWHVSRLLKLALVRGYRKYLLLILKRLLRNRCHKEDEENLNQETLSVSINQLFSPWH